MVGSVGNEQWQGCEAIDDGVASLGPSETLEQFLQHEPCREDALTIPEGFAQAPDTRLVAGPVTSQRQRPNARVNEEIHERERSAM